MAAPVHGALLLLALFVPSIGAPQTNTTSGQDPYARFLYPMGRSLPAPEVAIDVTDAPDLRSWAEHAQRLVREWFPLLTPLLATDNIRPPKRLQLRLKQGISAPAYTSGSEITASATWVQNHPDDFGMIIHEMVHIIQAYPNSRNKPGWLVEGIADYIRWWRYEPESRRTPIDPRRASYKDSYRTTAAFLAWIVGKYDRGIVRRLDEALRTRTYSDELFRTVTGKTVDDLWAEFMATIKPSL